MKRCPTCQRTFTDDSQKFCANDGTALVADEAPAFDPEATVMSSASQIKEEASSKPSSDALPPTQYFSPGSQPASPQSEQNIHQSYPPPSPAPGGQPAPAWPPTPPPPQQQQQPYYPQQGMAGGQPTPQWQGGQQQQQQPPWMPPGQQQPQGQNWGGGYPQRGQAPAGYAVPHAAQATKGQALSLITLLVGVISLLTLALIFAMSLRVIVPDGDVIQAAFYISGISGIIAFLLGIVTLISSRWRNKWMAILGLVISIPSILFFLYVIIDKGLP